MFSEQKWPVAKEYIVTCTGAVLSAHVTSPCIYRTWGESEAVGERA